MPRWIHLQLGHNLYKLRNILFQIYLDQLARVEHSVFMTSLQSPLQPLCPISNHFSLHWLKPSLHYSPHPLSSSASKSSSRMEYCDNIVGKRSTEVVTILRRIWTVAVSTRMGTSHCWKMHGNNWHKRAFRIQLPLQGLETCGNYPLWSHLFAQHDFKGIGNR